MSSCSLKEFLRKAPEIKESLEILVGNIGKLTSYASALADKMHSLLDHIDSLEGDVSELKGQLLKCKNLLLKTHITARSFMSGIEKLLRYGDLNQQDLAEMKQGVRDGKYSSLNDYLAQLSRYFNQASASYEHFKGFHTQAETACKTGIAECGKKRKEASKTIASSAGTVAKTAGIVAGVGGIAAGAAAAVAGIFTFGLGVPIVLGISAPLVVGVSAAASGGAIAGGGATFMAGRALSDIGSHYAAIENSFKEISDGFQYMVTNASNIDVSMFKFKNKVKGLSIASDDVAANTEKDFRSFGETLDILVDTIKEARKEIKSHREKMEADEKGVTDLKV